MQTPRGVRLCIVGSEVANGFVLDKNTQFFAQELFSRGYDLIESRILRDDPEQIIANWKTLFETGDLIINSGGLGPTPDDLTVDLLSDLLGVKPVYEPDAERRVRAFFERRKGNEKGISLDVALRQARIPDTTVPIKNIVGLAPGIFIPHIPFIALPGFPQEIKGQWDQVLEKIESLNLPKRKTTIIPIWGKGESEIFSNIQQPPEVDVGVHALPYGCRIFLRTKDNSETALNIQEQLADALHSNYPDLICEDPIEDFAVWAIQSKTTFALAESCTGGLASKLMTDIPGISAVYPGGVVSYANEAKTNLLNVPASVINSDGVVSMATAAHMAAGAAISLKAQLGFSFTGIAGPTGGLSNKPVGTVFCGIADLKEKTVHVVKLFYPFGRERFRSAAVYTLFLALWQRYVRFKGDTARWISSSPGKDFQLVENILG